MRWTGFIGPLFCLCQQNNNSSIISVIPFGKSKILDLPQKYRHLTISSTILLLLHIFPPFLFGWLLSCPYYASLSLHNAQRLFYALLSLKGPSISSDIYTVLTQPLEHTKPFNINHAGNMKCPHVLGTEKHDSTFILSVSHGKCGTNANYINK